ncbi:hypothetical protein K9T71_00015, partial [Escherichia coli]
MSIKNDGHYFCRAGGNRPDGLNEPVTHIRPFVPELVDGKPWQSYETAQIAVDLRFFQFVPGE